MTAAGLLEETKARGVLLEADGQRLRVDGPAEALTDALLAELVEAKPALLRLLVPLEQVRCGDCHFFERHPDTGPFEQPGGLCWHDDLPHTMGRNRWAADRRQCEGFEVQRDDD